MTTLHELPIYAVLEKFKTAMLNYNQIILSAAPGAGKTTVIPPEAAKLVSGKIRLIEPRRIAAKAASIAVTRPGAGPSIPSAEEVLSSLE